MRPGTCGLFLSAVWLSTAYGTPLHAEEPAVFRCGDMLLSSGTTEVTLMVRASPHGSFGYVEECPETSFAVKYSPAIIEDDEYRKQLINILRRSREGGGYSTRVSGLAIVTIVKEKSRYFGEIEFQSFEL
jgi:hypothetical protein